MEPVADLLQTSRALFSQPLARRTCLSPSLLLLLLHRSPPTHAFPAPPPETSRGPACFASHVGLPAHLVTQTSRGKPFLIVTRWRSPPVAPGSCDRTPLLSLFESCRAIMMVYACVRSNFMFIHSIIRICALGCASLRNALWIMKLTRSWRSRVPALVARLH